MYMAAPAAVAVENEDEKIELNFALLILAYTGERNPKGEEEADAPARANLACVWLDPFWTGLTARLQTHTAPMFHVNGCIRPMPPGTLQTLCRRGPDTADKAAACMSARTLCNSVKVHFFHERRDGEEMRRDFLYASGFPLACVFATMMMPPPSSSHTPALFGLFNYNFDDCSKEAIPYLRLAVHPLAPARVPATTLMLATHGPPLDEHERILRFCDWAKGTLQRMDPACESIFLNLRTICRDQRNTLMSQDLHMLFDTPLHTYLPPTLAVYALYGALWSNGQLPVEALYTLPAAVFLRVVRDLIACFSLCQHEGLYWPDTCKGQSVEDQPFPLTFMPAERVFHKDDCEGRATHIQQMVSLLRCMANSSDHAGLLAAMRQMASFRTLLSALSARTFEALVGACCHIGALFEHGVLDAQTTVGDVSFDASQSSAVGHSFTLLFMQAELCVIETTAWEHCVLPGFDREMSQAEKQLLVDGLIANPQIVARLQLCGSVSRAMEDRMYKRVYLGHDRLYFTRTGAAKKGGPVKYGASVQALRAQSPSVYHLSTRAFVQSCIRMGIEGAKQRLVDLDDIRSMLAHRRRVLRPPPRSEADTEALMCTTWAPLVPFEAAQPSSAGIYFSVPSSVRAEVDRLLPPPTTGSVATLPFMRSCLYNVCIPPR